VASVPTQSREAPGELDLVRAFVNTRDLDDGVDEFVDPAALEAWLGEHGLLQKGAGAGPADLRRAVALREALRELLLGNNDGRPASPEAAAAADAVAARAHLRLRVGGGTARLVAEAPGVDGALGRLLVIVYRAMETGTWPRLKACRNDTCQWAFYDHSKNRSGHWCSMAVCGSQQKSKAYRERQRSGVSEAEGD
jgi:predicted RNA-binding Zn ribbon-like protein